MRKLAFPLYIASGIFMVLAVCWVLWKQHLEQQRMNEAAQEIASGIGLCLMAYEEDHEYYLPGSLKELQQLQSDWSWPLDPLKDERVQEVPLFQNEEPFDVTILFGRSETTYGLGSSDGGRTADTTGSVAENKSVVVLVYGPPGFKGLDVDGDSLPDAVLAHYPSGPIDEGSYMCTKGLTGILERKGEPLELTVRRERDRLRDAGRKAGADDAASREH